MYLNASLLARLLLLFFKASDKKEPLDLFRVKARASDSYSLDTPHHIRLRQQFDLYSLDVVVLHFPIIPIGPGGKRHQIRQEVAVPERNRFTDII